MRVLIAADMEGVTGVVHWDQVADNRPEYPRFRRLMTADVNAAVRGACAGGATEVIVTDGHGAGRNIVIEDLDRRARLNSGSASWLSMVEGGDREPAAAMFVGYHARAGSPQAILDHTWSDTRVAELRINATPFGEIALNAAVLGHYGVPVVMVSGDRAACLEAREFLGEVETAVVKRATGRMAAECLTPEETGRAIFQAAERATRSVLGGGKWPPFVVSRPITVAVTFNQSEMADHAAVFPGSSRVGRTVEVRMPDMVDAYRAFQTFLALARP